MFNSDLESEFQNFRSSIPQRKVLVEICSQNSRLNDNNRQPPTRQVEWTIYDAGPRHITCPLILLPPAYAPTGAVFFRQLVALSNLGYRCIALDYPVIWLDRVHILGVEFGGYLAQRFAYFTHSLVIPTVGRVTPEQTGSFVALGSVDCVPLAPVRRPRVRSLILCSSFAFPPISAPVYPLAASLQTARDGPAAPPTSPASLTRPSSDAQQELSLSLPRNSNTIAQRYALSGASSLYWLLPGAVLRRVLTGPLSRAVAAWRSKALEWAHSHANTPEPDLLLFNAYQLLIDQAWKMSQAQLASRLTLVSERPPPLALKPMPRNQLADTQPLANSVSLANSSTSESTQNLSGIALNNQQLTASDITIIEIFESDAEQSEQRESLSLRYPGARLAFLKSGGLALYLTQADQVTLFVQVHLKQYDSTRHRARRASARRAASPEARHVKSSGALASQASA